MNKAVRGAVGSLKHEGMYLTLEEMELLAAYVAREISEEEFNRRALELALANHSKTRKGGTLDEQSA